MAVTAKSLLATERRRRISELLTQQGAVRVDELSTLFGVSDVTIRSDLDAMAREGLLLRDRGGAVAPSYPSLITAFRQRTRVHADEKRRIGHAAAALVKPNDTIIMDAGTTTMEMARSLVRNVPVTIVTNALNIATQVGSLSNVNVVVIGGTLSEETISTYGPQAERGLNDLNVQKVFLGTHAMEVEAGITDTTIDTAQVKQAMARAARQVILLADSSKWGRVAFAKVLPLSAVHTIVTDSGLPPEARAAIQRLGIELIVV